MTFEQWQTSVPEEMRKDSVWRIEAYRLSLFIADLSMMDFPQLVKNRTTWSHADQLLRAAGAISSDIAEGYSRGTGKDRAKFFEYALGSARESRDWYYKARASLNDSVIKHRIDVLTQIIRLLIRMTDTERKTNKRLLSQSTINITPLYKLHLILKYLRKRRIAWVSLVAVMLCTAMVLVVISVMGGWLRMFRHSFKGLNGDVLVEPNVANGLAGFPYYQQILDRISKLPDAAAATPVLHSFGLIKIGRFDPSGVQVIGYKIDQIGKVNDFPESLHRQHGMTPSFKPFLPESEYKDAVADDRVNPMAYHGMIVGEGVVGIHKNEKGEIVGRTPLMYTIPTTLTVMDMSAGGPISMSNARSRTYWIVDDSRTKVYTVDDNTVYVPFDVLQKDLGLSEHTVTISGRKFTVPARTSEIDIRAKAGADIPRLESQVRKIVTDVFTQNGGDYEIPDVYTWDQQPGTKGFLQAVENELVLVTFLFSLISIVAVFLIFCIFYMIVAEKTRDIGIIKSVGASSGGVAQIFLGYGLAIGIVGALAGLLLGYGIVHNINFLHSELGKLFGITIWRPDIYAFDTIPNTMDPIQVVIIVAVAIVASVIGSVVPAWRAARMNPVEALRWE